MLSNKGKIRSNCREKFFVHLSKLISLTFFLCLNTVVSFLVTQTAQFLPASGRNCFLLLEWVSLILSGSTPFLSFTAFPPTKFIRVTRGIWLAPPNSMVLESCSLHFVHSMLIPNAWGHIVRVQEIFVEPTTGPWLLYFSYSKASNERAVINKFNHSILLIKMKVKMLEESFHSSAPVFTASSAFCINSRKLIVETHTLFFFPVTYRSC